MPTVEVDLWVSGVELGVEVEVLIGAAIVAVVSGTCVGLAEVVVGEALGECAEVTWLVDVVLSADEVVGRLPVLLSITVKNLPDSCLMPIVVSGNAGCRMEIVDPS